MDATSTTQTIRLLQTDNSVLDWFQAPKDNASLIMTALTWTLSHLPQDTKETLRTPKWHSKIKMEPSQLFWLWLSLQSKSLLLVLLLQTCLSGKAHQSKSSSTPTALLLRADATHWLPPIKPLKIKPLQSVIFLTLQILFAKQTAAKQSQMP